MTSLNQINSPGKLQRLRVLANNTMLMFKNKDAEPRSIARELGADTVLVPKMYEQKNLHTFKFESINVADGFDCEPNTDPWGGTKVVPV